MNEPITLYVEKGTDEMRSTLTALGLADFLAKNHAGEGYKPTRVIDRGSLYVIESTPTYQDIQNRIEKYGRLPALLPAIKKPMSSGEKKALDAGDATEDEIFLKYVPYNFSGQKIDYGMEKEKPIPETNLYDDNPIDMPDFRHSDFPLWGHLVSYFGKGSAMRVAYPTVLHAWHAHTGESALALVDLILGLFGEYPNQIDEAETFWKKNILKGLAYADYKLTSNVSSIAVVSPTTSKGASDKTLHNNLTEGTPNTFWLIIYFALAGYMLTSLPYRLADGDVMLFYPRPTNIDINALRQLMVKHRQRASARNLYQYAGLSSRRKVAILGTIIYYQSMVEHYQENDLDEEDADLLNFMYGMTGYYYKDISTQIPFDETTYCLPPFMSQSTTTEDLYQATLILKDHREIIGRLRGDNADELRILDFYHRFIVFGNADDWLEFACLYGKYRFRQFEDKPYLFAMSNQLLKETLMGQDKMYAKIFKDDGFKKIAVIIRSATVSAQYQKSQNQNYPFKVRHGVLDDLRRYAHDKAKFLESLGDFLADYGRESMNVQKDTGEIRATYSVEDLQQVTALIDQYGSATVAKLLLASAFTPFETRTRQN